MIVNYICKRFNSGKLSICLGLGQMLGFTMVPCLETLLLITKINRKVFKICFAMPMQTICVVGCFLCDGVSSR